MNIHSIKVKSCFYAFIFLPLFLTFFLPFVFYKPPLLTSVFSAPTYSAALIYAFLVALIWFFIIYLILIWPAIKTKPSLVREWPRSLTPVLIIIFSVVGAIANYLDAYKMLPGSLSQFNIPLTFLSSAAIILIFYYWITKKNRDAFAKKTQWLLVFLFFLNLSVIIILPLKTGMSHQVAYAALAIFYALFRMLSNKRYLYLFLLLGAVLLPLLMVGKNYVREAHQFSSVKSVATIQKQHVSKREKQLERHLLKKISLKNLLVYDKFLASNNPIFNYYKMRLPDWPGMGYVRYLLVRIVSRLNHLSEFAYVILQTPQHIPYAKGHTYQVIPFTFIPRLLWKDKPVDDNGQYIGHRYHFIFDYDKVTAWALPLPTEGWVNFGLLGVILSAVVIGFLLRLAWYFFIGESSSVGNLVLGAVVVYCMSQGESGTNYVLGNLGHFLLFYWILDILIRRYSRSFNKRSEAKKELFR